jgi:hypothetical protein
MTSDPHDRLGAALRALADVVVRTGASPDEVEQAAAQVEALTARLADQPRAERVHDSPYHPMSLVGGTAHPWALQLHTVRDGAAVGGTVVLGAAYEGGPGLVHGGVLSLLFDHAMGQAVFETGNSAMTASLEVRYVAPTPLDEPLEVRAQVERIEGRRVHVSAQISAAGRVTATAAGLFIRLTPANVAQIFPARGSPPRREYPLRHT